MSHSHNGSRGADLRRQLVQWIWPYALSSEDGRTKRIRTLKALYGKTTARQKCVCRNMEGDYLPVRIAERVYGKPICIAFTWCCGAFLQASVLFTDAFQKTYPTQPPSYQPPELLLTYLFCIHLISQKPEVKQTWCGKSRRYKHPCH